MQPLVLASRLEDIIQIRAQDMAATPQTIFLAIQVVAKIFALIPRTVAITLTATKVVIMHIVVVVQEVLPPHQQRVTLATGNVGDKG